MKSPVFIPRPETEQLVGFVLDDIQRRLSTSTPPPLSSTSKSSDYDHNDAVDLDNESPILHCLEIGCGSGAISLSLLHEMRAWIENNNDNNRRNWRMTAIDVNLAAIDLTRENSTKLKLDNDLQLRHASINDIFKGTV